MFSIASEDFEPEESPTVREAPSGAWIVATDRAQRKLAAVIDALESGTEPADLVATLKEVHRLVHGRQP